MGKEILEYTFWNNSVWDYIIAAAIIVGSLIAVAIVRWVLQRHWLKGGEEGAAWKAFISDVLGGCIVPALSWMAIFLGVEKLQLPAWLDTGIDYLRAAILTFYGVKLAMLTLVYLMNRWSRKQGDEVAQGAVNALIPILRVLVWGIGLVFLMDNLGFEIAALVTGLGVTGIAVALAAQAILGDTFSYFVILLDKPFRIGDFIIVGDMLGTVEQVGLKTTRLRSLSGEQLVFPNNHLTSSRIKNMKRMEKRRVVFKVGVTYQTTVEQLKEIPVIVRTIIESIQDTTFDRSHFFNYGDSSLDIETVYYVLSPDYTKYMDIQQEICLRMKEEFEKRGIEYAYPTRTLFIEKGEEAKAS